MKGLKRIAIACAALVVMAVDGMPASEVDGTSPDTMAKVRRALGGCRTTASMTSSPSESKATW